MAIPNSLNMNYLKLIVLFFLCSPLVGKAQKYETQKMEAWYFSSEKVVLSDSVLIEVKNETLRKGIPQKVANKNLIYIKMLFNNALTREERILVADFILDSFKSFENQFYTNLVEKTKVKLLQY